MPELPEVETVRRGIKPLILGRTITDVICRVPKLRWELDPDLGRRLHGQKVKSVKRRAKYLLLELDHGTLVLHLGMTGILRVLHPDFTPVKHDHVDILFDDDQCLRFNDSRRFGALFYVEAQLEEHKLFKDLGPEPLMQSFNSTYLYERSRKCKGPVKNFLMSQKVVVGVGNIYASEALFASGIDPRRSANDISLARYGSLVAEVKSILAVAIKQGGTTIRDFENTDGMPGYFKQQLRVYGREGAPCVHCHNPVRNIRLGGRSTFYCPKCQK